MSDDLCSVGVVLVNWNSAEETIKAARSVLASRAVAPRLIVVDNGSTDNSATRLRDALPTSDLLLASANLGYASGVNIGLRRILEYGLDHAMVLNNDTTLYPDCIINLLEALGEEPAAGIAGPLIYYADEPQRIWYLADHHKRFLPVPVSLGRNQIDRGQFDRTLSADYVSGCAMLIRRPVLKEIGLFEERLFMHYEDADFCRRARKAGYGVLAVPSARMWHQVSRSGERLGPRIAYYRSRNRVWFYRTHSVGLSRVYALVYVMSHELLRAGRAWLTRDRDVARARWMGMWHGWRGRLGK